MFIFKWFFNAITTTAAIFAGLFIGARIREQVTGLPASAWQHRYTTRSGTKMANIPVITKFWPAVFYSFTGKPRWLSGLVGGILAGALVDDSYEDHVLEMIAERMGR